MSNYTKEFKLEAIRLLESKETGKLPLDFDPLNKLIEIKKSGTVF